MAGFGVRAAAPDGMSPLAREVFDIVAKHTVFAWPILSAQCKRGGVDPLRLDREGLRKVVRFVADGVGAFTSPEKASQVMADLARLADSW